MGSRAIVVAFLWLAAVLRAAPLRVGIEANTPPLSAVRADGQPEGFAVDLVRQLAQRQRLEIEFVAGPWTEIYEAFLAGKIDILANVAYSLERARVIDYAVPHIEMTAGLFLAAGQPAPHQLADLAGRRIGVSAKSVTHDFVAQQPWGTRIVGFANPTEALLALNRGECDAVVATRLIAMQAIRELNLQQVEISDLTVPELTYQLHLGLLAGRRELLYQLNLGLSRLRADGTIDKLHERWIGPLEPRRLRFRDVEPYLPTATLLAVVIAGAFLWQRRLLRQIARQAAKLRENEERLTYVLEGSDAGFWDWDMSTGHVERSERWAAMLGYTLAEVAPAPEGGRLLIHPEDLPAYLEVGRKIRGGEIERYDLEYRMRAKSGEWRWIHDRGKVVARDAAGRAQRMAGTHLDITVRKRTEAALLESQTLLKRSAQLLEQTQATAKTGGWELDLRSGRTFWTREMHRIHDTSPETFEPTREALAAMVRPACRATWETTLDRALREAQPFSLEIEILTAKQRPVTIALTGLPEVENGQLVKLYGSARDVTLEKNVEQEREQLRRKMLQAQKLESLGVLAGGIAHDFNNLLTVILANATFPRPAGSPEDPRLASIAAAARRAADLCRQMLAYAGKGAFVIEPIDVGALVQETAELLQVSISKKAKLHLSLGADLPAVDADAAQLRQVVMNLVINASDALDDRPGEIRIATRRARPERDGAPSSHPHAVLHWFELPPRECVCLEISDTGVGMDTATLGRIFDPFFTTKFTGRGLGLAAVLGIVRAHHGALAVESQPGAGSTFRLYLPVSERAPAAPPAPSTTPAIRPGGTLLVADDEPNVLAVTDALLRHHGFETVLANDGHEAVRLFRSEPGRFAAVVLDLTMPGLDGAEALRMIRAVQPDTPALVMSGFSEVDVFARLRGAGPAVILRKPFTPKMLLARIGDALGSR